MSRAIRVPWLLLVAVMMTTACTHNVMPKITPTKVPAVQPRIDSRAVLLLSASFEQYGTKESNGVHKWIYHYGEAMSGALTDLVGQSFTHADVRHVSDADVLRWLTASPDSAPADVLLIPYFEESGHQERMVDEVVDARIRLDARTLPANQTYSWAAQGHTARVFTSRKGLAGNTLEQVLRALSDSLAAHRAELEPRVVSGP
ncbi:MAG TPA: hypothetical protein VFP28_04435 [Gemmatimonadales bacterium]|nr:hypothetical protein [Gemmatimonadales bacterium]